MSLIRDEDKAELEKMFSSEMKEPVKIVYFAGEKDVYKKQIEEIMTELSKLSDKIIFEELDFEKNKEEAEKYGVSSTPCIAIAPDKGFKIKYCGIPSGYEFSSFIEDIKHISTGTNHLSDGTKEKIRSIEKPVKILVFVTPTCPYCPRAVSMAHQFAMENKLIDASMIEAIEYRELSEKYNVMAVPKIVINDKVEFEGAVPEGVFLNHFLKAVE